MKSSNILIRTFMSGTLFCLMFYSTCFAQEESSNSLVMEEIVERNSGTEDQEVDLTELTENLNELLEHPVNINKASIEELRAVGIFTEIQIKNLHAHIERFGKLLAIPELQVVDGFEESFIRQITPYIVVGREIDAPNASFSRMIKEGRHQLILRTQWIPQERKGFTTTNEGPEYLGDPRSVYLRYKFNFMKKLSWGITAEKDAGEQFFKGAQKQGFDFYSMHFAIRDVGPFKIILVGDYQLSYGQGLTLWTGLSGGKASDPAMIRKSGKGILPYSSSNEVYFKRGDRFSLKWKKFQPDFFFSIRNMDGNLKQAGDTLTSDEYLTSFQETGYHRTESEIADKNVVREILYGSHVGFQKRNFQIGFTGVHMQYTLPLEKNLEPYNQFEF
ncbi:MAG TPA: helix-hairpin-helix domain-containing protein, partial [Bacteroidia bacterium]|nr:helix-hairpin-helix domain-containing protein [Bacteroidia bacterium]